MKYRKLVVCAFAAMGLASTPPVATAAARLTDQEIKALFDSIEDKREAFESALDDKLKNSTIQADRGEVKADEFFDDFQDQVERVRERFKSDYAASSEVLSLLQYSTRLEAWASRQPAGFRGAPEWNTLASDLRRLAAAYNTTLLRPKQQGLGLLQARRLNDAERVTAAANLEKAIDSFRQAYDGVLAANTSLSPQSRQAAIQRVDVMKTNARALNAVIASNQKGIAEAEALLRSSSVMIDTSLKLPQGSAAAAAWTPVRDELAKVALAYEVTPIH